MNKIVITLQSAYLVLKQNLLDFHFTSNNPWLWICGGTIIFWMVKHWNLKKIIWFIISMGTLFFLKGVVYDYIGKLMPGAGNNYGDMIIGIVFSILVVIVLIYFLFIRQD
ncbi:MAG: hypothetical protein P9L96_05360 [Candidatus Gygaella obscura]|nr:hypothetical protein [Candidatus Gygaella obscura]